MDGPRVSLLMPNRDNAGVLDLVLERLATNTEYRDLELIVVDDGSTDGSRDILRRWRDSGRFAELRLIEQDHGGVVEALNAGLRAATGELVVQLDADASVETPDWLATMVAFFESDPRIGAVTAKVVFDWGEVHACGISVIGPAGLHDRGSEITEPAGRRTLHSRVRRTREDDCVRCRAIAEVDGGIGCCLMYRRSVALEEGGYDPGFAPVWFDDLDLTIRLRARGLKVFCLPDVRVVHHIGRRLTEGLPLRRRVVHGVRWRLGRLIPAGLRHGLGDRLGLDRPPPEHRARLEHHYAYWREKWGFDLLNPDMEAVRARWGETEVCWSDDPAKRAAGERIAAAFPASGRTGGGRAA